jgi:hypothetical protein
LDGSPYSGGGRSAVAVTDEVDLGGAGALSGGQDAAEAVAVDLDVVRAVAAVQAGVAHQSHAGLLRV